MKRKSRKLKETALGSLTLSVEIFNRPSPVARAQGVLLNLQHAFEMLFKAVVWERRGRICPKGSGKAYSFKECLGILRGLGLLTEDEAIVAATIDGHRDGVQHQGADVTEERLYLDALSGLRLFDELLQRAFSESLADHPMFAHRMLPISANPPREMHALTATDVDRVKQLLKPSLHRHAEALALLRTLVISDRVAADPLADVEQPTEHELERLGQTLRKTKDWTKLFPTLARLSLEVDEGLTYNLRIVKKGDAAPVRIVRPGEAGAEDAAAILKYSELDSYPFYLKDLREKAGGINQYDACALVFLLDMKNRPDLFKTFQMGTQRHDRYSHRALKELREALKAGRLSEARAAYKNRFKKSAAQPAAARSVAVSPNEMPKPGDLSVLGLRPNHHFTAPDCCQRGSEAWLPERAAMHELGVPTSHRFTD